MTRRIGAGDPACGFRCGKHALDDYFARHALPNDQAGIGRAYVLEASFEDVANGLPAVLGFYTLSMAAAVSADIASAVSKTLPRHPMPVALVGRLAVDERARGRRLGEALLIDALNRVISAAEVLGCLGVIVDQCPECPASHLDLSAEAFDLIADPLQGIVPISFRTVPCPVTGNVVIKQKDGVNVWWFAVQIRNHRYAIASVELRQTGSASWQNMARQDYNYFLLTSLPGLLFPVELRITDVHQHQIVETVTSVVPNSETPGTSQFLLCDGLFIDGFESGTASHRDSPARR